MLTGALSVITVWRGRVVHTLSQGEAINGVTSLAGEVYLLRNKERDQVEVYDVITYHLLRRINVPDVRTPTDMTCCEYNYCVYISDHGGKCAHRVDATGFAFMRWDVNDRPMHLSVNSAHNVLVTCPVVRKIKEFSSRGQLLRELALPDNIIMPWHTIQTRNDEFLLCHGGIHVAVKYVCKVSADGRHIVHSRGGQRGARLGQYSGPAHLAVDDNEFVFVADCVNRRVRLLSPTLGHVRDIVSRDQLKWLPCRLCLDVRRRRLYVADNEWNETEHKHTSGRVVVFSV